MQPTITTRSDVSGLLIRLLLLLLTALGVLGIFFLAPAEAATLLH
ncbi:MAG: hypothetical protein ACRDT6_22900 [Micromonosporaceae bacterium]